jgi:hypothetical protein
MRETDRLENPGIDRRITSLWIFRKWDGEHGLRIRALVNTVKNFFFFLNTVKNLRVP